MKNSYYQMPVIDLSKIELTEAERKIAQRIINTKTGQLRASKPPVPPKVEGAQIEDSLCHVWNYRDEEGALAGRAAYVWRMVAFMISPMPAHQCMPVMAFCDLGGDTAERRAQEKELDALADQIVSSIPADQMHGVKRWAKALGY